MKKYLSILVALVLALSLLVVAAPGVLAWQEGPGTDWWFINASVGDGNYYSTVPLVIEINGNPASGQVFTVGDTVTITGDLHAYAVSCAGGGNGAYTEWHLEVSGPSGSASDTASGYNSNNEECAEVDTQTTLSITYALTATGTHTVYMSSYAAVAQYWTDVADEYVDASLTFEVVILVDIDIKPGSDPNSINLGSKGVVPVAVLTTDDFDASTVDPSTVLFAGASPVRWTMEDVDGDGDMDLLFHFKTQEVNLDENSTAATLTGSTKGGQSIQGMDTVNIVPKGK